MHAITKSCSGVVRPQQRPCCRQAAGAASQCDVSFHMRVDMWKASAEGKVMVRVRVMA